MFYYYFNHSAVMPYSCVISSVTFVAFLLPGGVFPHADQINESSRRAGVSSNS